MNRQTLQNGLVKAKGVGYEMPKNQNTERAESDFERLAQW